MSILRPILVNSKKKYIFNTKRSLVENTINEGTWDHKYSRTIILLA